MRILHVVKTNIGAKWAFEQSKWLHENGIDIITVLPEIKGGMADKYEEAGMKIIKAEMSLPIKSPLKFNTRKQQIIKIVKDTQPDIIHTHFVTNIIMLRLSLKNINIPRLFQVPGPLHLENNFFKALDIRTSDSNDYWIGTCQKTVDIYLNSKISSNKVFLNYYGGYGGDILKMYKEKSGILKREYDLSNNNIIVGMISYFYKPKFYLGQTRGLKGHEDFIDAIAIVRKEDPNIKGIIVGGPWGKATNYMNKVIKYANKVCPDGIIFTGFRNDIKEIYREFDLVIHPSHSENLGGAAESLAAGVPTISTNVGGFPDIVIDGITGYTVDKKSPEKLAMKISHSLKNIEIIKKMSSVGQKRVMNLLDIENTGRDLLIILKGIKDG